MKKEVNEVTSESLRFLKSEEKKRILKEREAWLIRERKNDRKEMLRVKRIKENRTYRKRILSRKNIYIGNGIKLHYHVLLDKSDEIFESF